MKTYATLAAATLLFGISIVELSLAGPVTREEAQRQAQVVEQLKKSLAAETTDAAKFGHIARAMKDEKAVGLRRKILEAALQIPGPELGTFLAGLLATEEDAGIRSEAATALGKLGSEKQLDDLL